MIPGHFTPTAPIQPPTEVLLQMNESIVGELNSIKRKSQTQENTIAWLIQELLKSKKEIEELKRSVKTIQMSAEETQRKQVLDLVQGQQQHQRQLHLQLQQQLQAQPSYLPATTYPSATPAPLKTEMPSALDQLRAQQALMQQRSQQQQQQQQQAQTQQLSQSSFDLGLYLSMQNTGGATSPESSSDDGLAVLDNVYDGPDWIQMSQAQQ